MNKRQWEVTGFIFMLAMAWFIIQDVGFERACGVAGIPPENWDIESWDKYIEEKNFTRIDLWCINTELYDPFIWFFAIMWWICWINAWLEGKERKKK